jgi:hypothetical protein
VGGSIPPSHPNTLENLRSLHLFIGIEERSWASYARMSGFMIMFTLCFTMVNPTGGELVQAPRPTRMAVNFLSWHEVCVRVPSLSTPRYASFPFNNHKSFPSRENKWSDKVTLDKLEGKKDQFSNERKKNTMFPFVYPMFSLDFQALLKELAK